MRMKVTQLTAIAGLAVLDIVVGLAASAITVATGVTMASGVITSFSEPLILMVCLLVVRERGAAIIFMGIVSILALPIAYSGPPGFLPKIPIILLLGVICELLFWLLNRINTWLAAIVIGGVLCLWYTFAVALVARLLDIPGLDNFLEIMPIWQLSVIVFTMGAIGGALGVFIYQRISNSSVVLRIQGV